MVWFADMLTMATEGRSAPVQWITCIVAGLIVYTVLKAFAAIFKR